MTKCARLLTGLLLFTAPAFAWNHSGHDMGGCIAYYYLKANSPATISKVERILTQHPWYSNRWAADLAGLSGEQRAIRLFMLASTFPDDARDEPSLGGGIKTHWHYVDYPFVPAGQRISAPAPESPNAEEKIGAIISALKSEPDGAQKAIDLCWLFHLIEDLHQPLHATSLYDANHPRGDKGGNDTYFITSHSEKPHKLHGYWDDLIHGNDETIPAKAVSLFDELSSDGNIKKELHDHTTVHQWAIESFDIARQQAYLDGRISGTYDAPSPLLEDYHKNAEDIAQRRIMLAGMRLGNELKTIIR